MSGSPSSRPGADGQAGAAGLRLVAVAVVGGAGGRRQGQPERAAGRRRLGVLGESRPELTAAAGGGPAPTGSVAGGRLAPRWSASGAGCTSTAGARPRSATACCSTSTRRTSVVPRPLGTGRRPGRPGALTARGHAGGRAGPPLRRRAGDAIGAWLVSVEERHGDGRPPSTGWWRWPCDGSHRVVAAGRRPGLRGRPAPVPGRPVGGLGRLGPPLHALGQLRALAGPPRGVRRPVTVR